MEITTGDRFYSSKHAEHGTVVGFHAFDNWTFALDSEPTKVLRAKYSPNLVRWEKVASIDGDITSLHHRGGL